MINKTSMLKRIGLVTIVLMLFMGFELWSIARIKSWNRQIMKSEITEVQSSSPPQVKFARARELDGKNDQSAALVLYKGLEAQGDLVLRNDARFNSGNLYMRKAQALRDTPLESQAVPLVELAKQSYREVLRADPQNWDARYNLERALRVQPDADEGTVGEFVAPLNSERAVTTMRGVTLGLP
ncbi:MAG: MxaK protein [Burkholderiales bacterium]